MGRAMAQELDDDDIARLDFRAVCDGELAGCSLPGNGSALQLPRDLRWLYEQGIRMVVSLNEGPSLQLPSAITAFRDIGITNIRLESADYGAPSIEDLHRFVSIVQEERSKGGRTVVHCNAGQGRTGTMLCVYQIANGISLDEAMVNSSGCRSYKPTNE